MEISKVSISVSVGGISFLCFIVFLILKLCGVIAWDWLYVCIPLMVIAGEIAIFIILVVVICLLTAIAAIFQ